MIRGVSFTINRQVGDILHSMLSEIDAEKYYWHIVLSQTEALDELFENTIFLSEYYDGKAILGCNFHNSHIVFLKLEAYFEKKCANPILSYTDFQESDCQLLLLINDCENAELYVKSESLLHSAEKCIQKHHCYPYSFITDENDKRIKMNVL